VSVCIYTCINYWQIATFTRRTLKTTTILHYVWLAYRTYASFSNEWWAPATVLSRLPRFFWGEIMAVGGTWRARSSSLLWEFGAEPPAESSGRPMVRGSGGEGPFYCFSRLARPQIRVLFGIWTRTRARKMLLNVYELPQKFTQLSTLSLLSSSSISS